ncbi:hypothetical protein J6590_101426 [Homalodisca vitripennis]|nr:hypothetical protein J6590_027077 [Homalodisca vitripennis]KAG8294514.1 hypothetical protein J6590_101426 [Homalodisca vitripennis]
MSNHLCFIIVVVLFLVTLAASQNDPFDEAHSCQMFRQCKDCVSYEFCVKVTSTWLYRWWYPCPASAPYCNPYSQRCEATLTPICQTLLNATATG